MANHPKRMFATRDQLLSGIATFAKADVAHYQEMKDVIAGCILHASDHGDLDPLSILYRTVSTPTKAVVKRAVKRINIHFGQDHQVAGEAFGLISFATKYEHILENGSQGPNHNLETFFFTQKVERGEKVLVGPEEAKKIRNEIRASLSAVDEPTLARFIDSAESAANNGITVLPNIADDLARIIKRHAQMHATPKGVLVELNKLIKGQDNSKALNVDQLWDSGSNPNDWNDKKEKELQQLLANKKRAEDAIKAQLEAQKAEGHAETKPEDAKTEKSRSKAAA